MSKKRSIDTHFWNDGYTSTLDPDYKLLFLYLITSPLSNMLGCYEIPLRRIQFDTGLPLETIKEGFETFKKDKKAEYLDNYVILVNFVTNQNYNTNMLKSAVDQIEELPSEVLKSPLFELLMKGLERVSKGKVTVPNIEVEVEREIEVERESESSRAFENPSAILAKRRSEPKEINYSISGFPLPEILQYKEFYEQYKKYLTYMEESHGQMATAITVENDIGQLVRLKNQGNDPVAVIQQTMSGRNKSFFPLRDKQFESNTKTNGKANSHQQNNNSRYSGHGK